VRASVIGTVTGTGRLRVLDRVDGEVLADMPAKSLEDDAPRYDRPRQAPADLAARQSDSPAALPPPADAGAVLLDLLSDTSWIWSQYDHQLFLNTVEGPGGDAALLRLKHPTTGEDTGRALALTTDGNHRWCAVDPRVGAAMVVAEAALNLACVGARPVALVNCLNFGNPEHAEVMWQLSETIDGLGDACRALHIPVVGGNVSLYNESRERDIDPTPIIGVLGVVDHLERRPPGAGLRDGDVLLVAGPPSTELAGSQWAWAQGHRGGALADVDFDGHAAVCELVRGLVADGVVDGVHDVADGGLGLALAEAAVRSEVGFAVNVEGGHAGLFAEGPSRVLLSAAPDRVAELDTRARAAGVPLARIGVAGGDRLAVEGQLDVPLAAAVDAWRDHLPDALGAGTAQ
jgi:phosphoribosylformylglycinamidine synthase